MIESLALSAECAGMSELLESSKLPCMGDESDIREPAAFTIPITFFFLQTPDWMRRGIYSRGSGTVVGYKPREGAGGPFSAAASRTEIYSFEQLRQRHISCHSMYSECEGFFEMGITLVWVCF